jgi:hypothetical protein
MFFGGSFVCVFPAYMYWILFFTYWHSSEK